MTVKYTYRKALTDSLLPFSVILFVLCIGAAMLKYYENTWLPDISVLHHWDAGWYKNIVDNGYVFDPAGANNTAFFPLFPYVWKWLGVNELGMAVVNGLLFVIASVVLFRFFPSTFKVKLAWLALSIIVFYITPFSETLFFVFSLLILIGLQEKRRWPLVVVGIVGAGLARSVCTVFFPAFLLLGFLKFSESRRIKDALPCFGYSLISLATLLGVFFIHWYQTGVFWAFSITQKYWGSGFRVPESPFSTWDPQDNALYDQLALFVCLFSIVYLIYLLIRTVIQRRERAVDDPMVFSLLYFSGVALLMLITRGGGFNSINRYVFCTVFIYILIRHLSLLQAPKGRVVSLLVLGILYYMICWHMATTLERGAAACGQLLLAFLFPWSIKKSGWAPGMVFWVLTILMVLIQGVLLYRYIIGIWVG